MARKTPARRATPRAKPLPRRRNKRPPPPPVSPTLPPKDGSSILWSLAPGEVGVRVRMYRVGFGDFFLLTFLTDTKPAHIVVDCGVFKGTSQTGDIGSLEAAVADMAQTTEGEVALIVVTHRHADHIAGFARCADTFRKFKVGGVWLSIWENEYEPTAAKFQTALTRAALALQRHFTALGAGASEGQNTARKYMENATGELGVAAKATNAVALDLLKRGFPGITPNYYKSGDKAHLPQALADAGLTCKILGPPPVSDIDLMKLMDLQKNVGQYLAEDGGGEGSGDSTPFGSEWEIDPSAVVAKGQTEFYSPESFREWAPSRKYWESITQQEALRGRRRMEQALRESTPIATLTAAKKLNDFLNNQSLVILFTFKGKKLLFVGDAQAGNWEHWLFDTDKPDQKASGTIFPESRQILTSLDFYKVGHHGSGNATPKTVAEMMGAQAHHFAAMCSTEAKVYGTENPDDPTKGTEVPRGPLLDKLRSESALVRSDQIAITVNGKPIPATAPAPIPTAPTGSRFQQGPLWVDCYL